MVSEHYFSASPTSPEHLRQVRVEIGGVQVEVSTAGGVFSPDRIDSGTRVLLANVPEPPPGGDLLDLGCGWGPVALTLAMRSPRARVWAVDVNERALDLTRRNAAALGLHNLTAATPDEVPADVQFRTIWSNPPIRIGKQNLHLLLQRWLTRLDRRSDGWFVVQRNLGADSLHRWLVASLDPGYSVFRAATGRGFRVLKVRRHGEPPTAAIELP